MEKVDDCIFKIPSVLVKIIKEQQNYEQFKNYVEKVENDIKYFKMHDTFPKHISNDSCIENGKQVSHQSQTTKRIALKENLCLTDGHQVKLERISEVPQNGTENGSFQCYSQKENIDADEPNMPPPQLPIKRNRKIKKELSVSNTRSTRSKTSSQTNKISDNNFGRDSDVILQKQSIETINLSDSDDESKNSMNNLSKQRKNNSEDGKNNSEEITTRTTRTKTRIKKTNNEENAKRIRSPSSDIEKEIKTTETRQMKRKKSEESSELEASINKNANSNLTNVDETNVVNKIISQQKLNETYVATKNSQKDNIANIFDKTVVIQKGIQNTTVVLEKGLLLATDENGISDLSKQIINNCATPNLHDIMTDDEDDNIMVTVAKKTNYNVKKNTKAIFSPFDGSPVKKRVEAFEKLGAENTSEIPIRSTRIKTKAKAKEKEQEQSTLTPKSKENREIKTTPQILSRFIPLVSSSANKTLKSNLINESFFSTKSASALKASQQEFIEREIKRREKEAEAIKKRDAHLHAQTEEKKKKRLEKQIKAQQLREAHEKSKMKALEDAERMKEEKHKQFLVEKQEKLKKQQEELERKRQGALKKALEEKRKATEEEQLKQEELRKALQEERRAVRALEHKKKVKGPLPIYWREKAPLLPTEDCYDSDQEDVDVRKIRRPLWTSTEKIARKLKTLQFVDGNIVSNFLIMEVTTPNLQDIFENIDPKKLKRTSSAVWRAPPRSTLIPQTIEEKDEEDC